MSVIVVATDGSAAAQEALKAAIGLADASHDRIAVITVWRALQHDFGLAYAPGAALDDLLAQERAHAEHTLAEAVDACSAAGVAAETHLAVGDPAEQICAFADEVDARLIAMGTHGYGPVLRLLMGSVSAAVIERGRRPVLVVRDSHDGAGASDADERAGLLEVGGPSDRAPR
jgi:nucleotide-binding universal stress UspA family protein